MRIKTVLLTSTTFLKLSALCLAFFLWSMLSDLYVMSVTYTVPVTTVPVTTASGSAASSMNTGAAHEPPADLVVTSKPDHVAVTLRGLRKYVRAIDTKNLFIAVDPAQLSEGPNRITVTAATLGLPNVISVVDYTPMNLTIVAEHGDATHSGIENEASSGTSQQHI